MIQYINTHDKKLRYPEILHGFVDSCRPSEITLLKIFEK
jgi:hypothetical protein